MARHERRDVNATGAIVAFLVGILVGLALGYPALPTAESGGFSVSFAGATVGPVGTVLLAGALAVLLVPLGMMALYQVFSLLDR